MLWFLGGLSSGGLSLRFLAVNATAAGFLALAGVAQMTVMASGGGSFDLSLPYIITLSAYVMSAASGGMLGGNQAIAVLLSLAVGLGAGMVNALLVWFLRIPPMVATLACGYILYSLIVGIQRSSTSVAGGSLQSLLRAQVFGFTGALAVCIATLVAMWVLLRRTRYGYFLHAMGQNREAARLSGVPLGTMTLITFSVSGLLAAWLGVLISSFQGAPSTNLGTTYLMGSVAAVVVGGTSISGGQTSVWGTTLGAFVLTFVVTDLIVWQLQPGFQHLIQGLIVIATVAVTKLAEIRRGTTRSKQHTAQERGSK
jgi:ribose transport system permease protein